jgi:LmbE family N-acetylglucosaminyl deacetylase
MPPAPPSHDLRAANRTALVICPHADDAAAFCGGTVLKMAQLGFHVVLVRVTDDARDSLGLSLEETVARNTAELAIAAQILGVGEIVELGYATDCLGDASEVELRERFVYLFRKYRPYAVLSFDPFGLYENNQDHIKTAHACDEAFWVACFDKHHPEHLALGLEPFSVCERWYYARHPRDSNHYEDVTDQIERRIDALCAHQTMMSHMVHMQKLQLDSWGRSVPLVDQAAAGDLRAVLAPALLAQAQKAAQRAGLPPGRYAEAFRLDRFGGWEETFQQTALPLEGVEGGPLRPGLAGFEPAQTETAGTSETSEKEERS